MKSPKSKKIVFIADLFREDVLGGAECNDSVLIEHFESRGHKVVKVRSTEANASSLQPYDGPDTVYVVGNFVGLSEETKNMLMDDRRSYIIYEHDHKYVKTRDPSRFKNFKAPPEQIINKDFYQNAKAVVVLSKVCKDVLKRNIPFAKVYNIGCSLWSEERLELLERLSTSEKTTEVAVLNSPNPTKGTRAAVNYCTKNQIKHEFIWSDVEEEFLTQLAESRKLVYIPQVLETFCRLAAEAKMVNCKLITKPKMLGFASEECFELQGKELVQEIRRRVDKALNLFDVLVEQKKLPREIKKIAFIGKFRRIYDEQGKALALERQGVEVRRFDEFTFNKVGPNNLKTLLDCRPDVVVFTKLRVPRAQELIDECKKRGIVTVSWMPDLYFGLAREREVLNKTPMFRADFVFSPDGGNDVKFAECGVNHHLVRQAIYDESCELRDVEKKYDALFVGTLGPEHGSSRATLLRFLEKEYGNRFYWAGRTGPHEIRDDALTQLISESKIVIGDCVLSDKYWSNRIYETLGRGGFLIHPRVPGLEEEFEDGKHLVMFEPGDLEDLKKKIEHYLHYDKAREAIREQGMKFVKEKHTLMNRAEQVLEILSNG